MSRHYRWYKEEWVTRSHARPLSPAWIKARAARAARRANAVEQVRDPQGFIPREVGGRVVMHDPGPIDRWLFLREHRGGS